MNPIIHPQFHGVYKKNDFSLKWFAAVHYKNLHKQLGLFDSDKLAAKGYDAAVIRLHLEDVLDLNFPPKPKPSFKTISALLHKSCACNGLPGLGTCEGRAAAIRLRSNPINN